MRIFIAITFSPAIKNKISNAIELLKTKNYHGQKTAHDNLHLTLHYIGDANQAKLEVLINQLKQLSFNQFTIQTKCIGMFGKGKKKKILYLEINDSYDLNQLHNLVIKTLNSIDYEIEAYNFIPHITLMRHVEVNDEIINDIELDTYEILVKSISIMESKRVNDELIYEPIEYINLKK